MKKSLLAVVAALAIAGCSQTEIDGIDNGTQDSKKEIKFGYSVVSRGTVTTTATLSHFKVNAYAHLDTYSPTAVTQDLISNVQFDKTEGTWAPKESGLKFYWPTTQSVTFFAFSPETIADASYTKEASKAPTLSYTVSDNISTQEDVLIAKYTNTTTDDRESSVSLPFKHALTQVIFKLKGEDSKINYDVKSITVKSVKNKGTYDYDTNKWTPTTDIKDYTINLTNVTFSGEAVDPVSLLAADQIMICMPQDLSNVTVEVSYSATLNGIEVHSFDNIVSKTLGGTWQGGAKVAYALLLSGDKMEISGGSIDEDWSDKAGTLN